MQVFVRNFHAIHIVDGLQCTLCFSKIHKSHTPASVGPLLLQHFDAQNGAVWCKSAHTYTLCNYHRACIDKWPASSTSQIGKGKTNQELVWCWKQDLELLHRDKENYRTQQQELQSGDILLSI